MPSFIYIHWHLFSTSYYLEDLSLNSDSRSSISSPDHQASHFYTVSSISCKMNLSDKAILFILLAFAHLTNVVTCTQSTWTNNNDPSNSKPSDIVITYQQSGDIRPRTLHLTMQESENNRDILKVNHFFPQPVSVVAASIVSGPRGAACLFIFRPTTVVNDEADSLEDAGEILQDDDFLLSNDEFDGDRGRSAGGRGRSGDENDGEGRKGISSSSEAGETRRNAATRAAILPFDFMSRREAKDFNEIFCSAPAYQDLLQWVFVYF